jgi:hypothetical protein
VSAFSGPAGPEDWTLACDCSGTSRGRFASGASTAGGLVRSPRASNSNGISSSIQHHSCLNCSGQMMPYKPNKQNDLHKRAQKRPNSEKAASTVVMTQRRSVCRHRFNPVVRVKKERLPRFANRRLRMPHLTVAMRELRRERARRGRRRDARSGRPCADAPARSLARPPAKLCAPVVHERLLEFRARVHHEGSVLHHRLAHRPSLQQKISTDPFAASIGTARSARIWIVAGHATTRRPIFNEVPADTWSVRTLRSAVRTVD